MSTKMSTTAAAYIQSVNQHDAAMFRALFTDQSAVDDAGRQFLGRDAIKDWSDREIFGANVTLEVKNVIERDGETVITTEVDGTFDRTGLPNPVIINHHLRTDGGKITKLTCRLAS
jgi:SnoaL-like domain